MLSNPTGAVGGSDLGLQTYELSFQQDLNGDGRIGPKTTTIESFGATTLVEVGNQFQMWGAGNSGPTLGFQGTPFTDGEFGTWKPIGAEKTASGYETAWKNGTLDQYAVWLTDGNGNMLSNPTGVVAGSNLGLQTYETSFQQDLNGDGTIGILSKAGTV
jgi:serralysin